MRGLLALLDPLLGGPALVVEMHDGLIGEREIRHDEAHAREQLADVMLDFCHDPSGRLLFAPDGSGNKIAGIVTAHCGSLADGEAAVRPIKAFGPPVMDVMGPIPYCTQNGLLDAAFPKGAMNYWKAQFLTDLSDASIDAIVDSFDASGSA